MFLSLLGISTHGWVLVGFECNPLAVNVHLGKLDLFGCVEVAVNCQKGNFVVLNGERKHWSLKRPFVASCSNPHWVDWLHKISHRLVSLLVVRLFSLGLWAARRGLPRLSPQAR